MAWIESHQALGAHPKTKRAARLLDCSRPAIVGHLHYLWWFALDYAQDGDLTGLDVADIAEAAMWDGEPEQFIEAMVNAGLPGQPGFLDRTDDGRLLIHDWHDYAGRLIERRHKDVERVRAWRSRQAAAAASTDAVASPSLPDTTSVAHGDDTSTLRVTYDGTVPTVPTVPVNPSVSTDVLTSPQPGSAATVSTPIEPVTDEPPQVAPAPAEQRAKPVTKPRYSAAYERLWERYPKPGRTDKAGAYAEYKRQQPPDDDLDAGLARWEASDRWAKGYIVSLKKWLHERRWEDEPEPASSARASPGTTSLTLLPGTSTRRAPHGNRELPSEDEYAAYKAERERRFGHSGQPVSAVQGGGLVSPAAQTGQQQRGD